MPERPLLSTYWLPINVLGGLMNLLEDEEEQVNQVAVALAVQLMERLGEHNLYGISCIEKVRNGLCIEWRRYAVLCEVFPNRIDVWAGGSMICYSIESAIERLLNVFAM